MNFLDQRNQGLFRGGDTINTFSASALLFPVYASTFCLLQGHEGLKHTRLPWRRGVRSDTAGRLRREMTSGVCLVGNPTRCPTRTFTTSD